MATQQNLGVAVARPVEVVPGVDTPTKLGLWAGPFSAGARLHSRLPLQAYTQLEVTNHMSRFLLVKSDRKKWFSFLSCPQVHSERPVGLTRRP